MFGAPIGTVYVIGLGLPSVPYLPLTGSLLSVPGTAVVFPSDSLRANGCSELTPCTSKV
jgi:hypothetical protein